MISQAQINFLRVNVYKDLSYIDESIESISSLTSSSRQDVAYLAAEYYKRLSRYKEIINRVTIFSSDIEDFYNRLNEDIENELYTINEELSSLVVKIFIELIISILAALVAGVIISIAITRYINSAIQKTVHFANEISQGNLSVDIDTEFLDLKDEIGDLSRTLNTMIISLRNVIEGVIKGSENITSASEQASSTSQELSSSANEQASSVEEMSSTLEEMTANIQQNSENAIKSREKAESIGRQMIEVDKSATESVEAIQLINEKIKVINNI